MEREAAVIYIQEIEQVVKKYDTDIKNGLNDKKVKKRLEKYGRNELQQDAGVSAREIFINQFKNIIVLLLMAAAAIAFIIGDYIEGFAVLAVIILNALFGFFTEYKAEKSVQALKKMVTTRAKVIRDSSLEQVEVTSVVPGDVLVLEEGDRVSADGRLLEADNLAVDEAVLTGESEPVNKIEESLEEEEISLAEQKNMVFMGTAVTRGNGIAIVTATGTDTEMGKISNLLHQTESEESPIEQRLDKIGKSLIMLTLIIAAIISVVGIILGRPMVEMIKTGIALAIAAVPEGLPAVATITLAIGMRKMARYNALVRRLPAVETLGSTTVICTDKTGTLTENQMTVRKIYFKNNTIEVTGTGYEPEGEFRQVKDKEVLSTFLKGGTLCSNAVVEEKGGLWQVIGDPTEGALVTAARKAGFDRDELEESGYSRRQEIPFTSEQKYMAVLYTTPQDGQIAYAKGAPAVVIDMCKKIRIGDQVVALSGDIKQELKNKNHELAGEGLRVLAVAYKDKIDDRQVAKENKQEKKDKFETLINNGLIFSGLAGLMDPPRSDVKDAITEARKAGVRTVMITGDQADTARAIADKVGIVSDTREAVTGRQIKGLKMKELTEKIRINSVFARVSPENKLDIVDALNENNEITAMTGDGVNDAPALKKADIGVAMGQKGTAVAREAADMVLLDDKFSTIVQAVKQGRVIFDNIEKFIYYLLSCNLSEIMFIFFGIVLQVPVPLLALQILWLNLVTDVFPALVLAWEIPETGVMSRPPRKPGTPILIADFKKKIGLHAFIIILGPLFSYLYTLQLGYPLAESRSIGFMTLAFVQLFHVFDARRQQGTGFDQTMFENLYLWGAIMLTTLLQFLSVYFPPLRQILKTTFITVTDWSFIVVGAVIPVLIIQFIRLIRE